MAPSSGRMMGAGSTWTAPGNTAWLESPPFAASSSMLRSRGEPMALIISY